MGDTPPPFRWPRVDAFSTPRRQLTMQQSPPELPAARHALSTPSRRGRNTQDMLALPDLTTLSLTSHNYDTSPRPYHLYQQPQTEHTPQSQTSAILSTPNYTLRPDDGPISSQSLPSSRLPTKPSHVAKPGHGPFSSVDLQISGMRNAPTHAVIPGGPPSHTRFEHRLGTSQFLVSPSTPVERLEDILPDCVFTSKFEHLFNIVEKYCCYHINFPSNAKDQDLPQHIKDRLMNTATRETASQIASTGHTRFFLMTKMIIQWMIKHVFKQDLFASFDLEADRRIAAIRDNIYQDTPTMVKHQLLSDIRTETQPILQSARFPAFLDTLVRNQSSKLWSIARPLMHQTTAMDWEDLQDLMQQAHSLAVDMATTPYQWRFDFAAIGTRYHTDMVNRDPYLLIGGDDEVARCAYPVRLCFVPTVLVRDHEGGVVRTAKVTRQRVILKS